jgi:hypothetical protein
MITSMGVQPCMTWIKSLPPKKYVIPIYKNLVSPIFRVFLHHYLFSSHASKIQRIFKIYRGKNAPFNYLILKQFLRPKANPQVVMLWSQHFFRHKDWQNWLMSYFDVICIIRHQMTHMTSNDAYDIKWRIWHQNMTYVNFEDLGV